MQCLLALVIGAGPASRIQSCRFYHDWIVIQKASRDLRWLQALIYAGAPQIHYSSGMPLPYETCFSSSDCPAARLKGSDNLWQQRTWGSDSELVMARSGDLGFRIGTRCSTRFTKTMLKSSLVDSHCADCGKPGCPNSQNRSDSLWCVKFEVRNRRASPTAT